MALVCAACTLDGCRKNDGNESKGPNVEGVFWFEEEEPAPGVMMGLYLKDGNRLPRDRNCKIGRQPQPFPRVRG